MKIEIAEPGRMTQSGSSLRRLIQNNKTPILDLLVRESIQNSLDAHKANATSVTVQFITNSFSSDRLSRELEGISDTLLSRFPSESYQYLAIRDSDTVGLTGPIDYMDVVDNKYGNLLKLVYEIGKPQDSEGAGGSWGLGKTIYFRIGIGLVIYYSRIENPDGTFSSRLVASLVEDETEEDAMIPAYKGMTRRGIAWWGQETGKENTTMPVTDEAYISDFLEIFGVDPYSGNETGTMIIIPYINSDELLANNRLDYSDELGEQALPYWYSSLENYLRIAVQRWYAPRLSNLDYPHGAYLRVLVNDTGISLNSMEPVFRVVQALYNNANNVNRDDLYGDITGEMFVESVNLNKLLDDTVAGNVAYAKFDRGVLKMTPPENKSEPAVFFNCEIAEKTSNRPLIFFVRKPGMIVSYETISPWTAGIPSTDKNEYIFGIFVLNSNNRFKDVNSPVTMLEEYIRKSEMADHTSWNDWTFPSFNPRIISKIQKSVTNKIGSKFSDDDVEHQPRENSELSRLLGDLILPPQGHGKEPGIKAGSSGTGTGGTSSKKMSFSADVRNIRYHADEMEVPMELKTVSNRKIRHTGFEIQIDSENGKISLDEWESSLDLNAPFSVKEISINIRMCDGEKKNETLVTNKNSLITQYEDVVFTLKTTAKGTINGLDVTSSVEHSFSVRFRTIIGLKEKNVRPAFVFEKESK